MTLTFPFDPATLSRDAFIARFGDVYEHSPWAAAAIYDDGVRAEDRVVAALAARLAAVVDDTSDGVKLDLLCAHPELAGRLAISGDLTAASASEQAGAGLDQCSEAEFAEFTQLNDAYSARFGHPFIIAVAGLDRAAILDAFRARLGNSAETERETALREVHKIARIRLERMAGAPTA